MDLLFTRSSLSSTGFAELLTLLATPKGDRGCASFAKVRELFLRLRIGEEGSSAGLVLGDGDGEEEAGGEGVRSSDEARAWYDRRVYRGG